jgi:hypothetical protein
MRNPYGLKEIPMADPKEDQGNQPRRRGTGPGQPPAGHPVDASQEPKPAGSQTGGGTPATSGPVPGTPGAVPHAAEPPGGESEGRPQGSPQRTNPTSWNQPSTATPQSQPGEPNPRTAAYPQSRSAGDATNRPTEARDPAHLEAERVRNEESRMAAEGKDAREEVMRQTEERHAALEREVNELAEARAKLQQEIAEQEANSLQAKRNELARIERMLGERGQAHRAMARGNMSEEERKSRILQRANVNDLRAALEQFDKDELGRMAEQEIAGELRRRGEKID